MDVTTQSANGEIAAMATVEMCVLNGTHTGRRVRVVCMEDQATEPPASLHTDAAPESVVSIEVDGRVIATLYLGNRDVFPDGTLILETRPRQMQEVADDAPLPHLWVVNDTSDEYEVVLHERAKIISRARVGTPIERSADRAVAQGLTRDWHRQNEAHATRDASEWGYATKIPQNSASWQFREPDPLPDGTFADVPVPPDLW